MNVRRQRLLLGSAIFLWVVAIALGTREFWHHSHLPGKLAATPEVWPAGIEGHVQGRPALAVFLHAECPCSKATVTELSRLVSRTPKNLDILVYFPRSNDGKEALENTTLWRSVIQIPNAKAVQDNGGRMAKIFGAETSGTTLLYDQEGKLRFRGGITAARGRAGENASEEALLSSLSNVKTQPVTTNVFGCSLF